MNLIRQHEKRLFTLAPFSDPHTTHHARRMHTHTHTHTYTHTHTHTRTQVDMKVSQYARYIFEPVDTNWSVVHEDGDMKVQLTHLDPPLHVFSILPPLSCSHYSLLFPSTLLPFCFIPLNFPPSSLLFFLSPSLLPLPSSSSPLLNTTNTLSLLLLSIMKVYRRELEEDGVVVDPLKASYTAKVSES